MAATTDDGSEGFETVGVEAAHLDRYADIRVDDEQVLIYDREVERAWIQSDSALDDEQVLIYDREVERAWIQSDSALGLEFMA